MAESEASKRFRILWSRFQFRVHARTHFTILWEYHRRRVHQGGRQRN